MKIYKTFLLLFPTAVFKEISLAKDSLNIQGDYWLPNGKFINIDTTYALRYDEEPIEVNGVQPDILVKQSTNDIEKGQDKQLEYAIQ